MGDTDDAGNMYDTGDDGELQMTGKTNLYDTGDDFEDGNDDVNVEGPMYDVGSDAAPVVIKKPTSSVRARAASHAKSMDLALYDRASDATGESDAAPAKSKAKGTAALYDMASDVTSAPAPAKAKAKGTTALYDMASDVTSAPSPGKAKAAAKKDARGAAALYDMASDVAPGGGVEAPRTADVRDRKTSINLALYDMASSVQDTEPLESSDTPDTGAGSDSIPMFHTKAKKADVPISPQAPTSFAVDNPTVVNPMFGINLMAETSFAGFDDDDDAINSRPLRNGGYLELGNDDV